MKVKLTRSTLLFYTAYIMWIGINILKFTYYRDIYIIANILKFLNIFVYAILFLKLIYDNRYSLKTIVVGIISILVLIVSINSQSRLLFETILFIYSSRNVPFKDIVRVTLNTHIILMTFIVLSSLVGIIKNDVWYRNDGSTRFGLGYTYCTFIANFYFHMILMYMYLKENKKVSIVSILLILLINKVIFILTDTKAVYYLVNILTIFLYLLNYLSINLKNNILSKILFKYCFLISAIISILLSINYDASKEIYRILNDILTDRLVLGNIMYNDYGIPLLGQSVAWVTGRAGIDRPINSVYRFVDSSYLNIAINYGIIILILVCIGFIIVGKKLIKKNNIKGCIAILFLAIHSITDPQLLQPQYHPFLLMFGYLFYENNKYIKISGC